MGLLGFGIPIITRVGLFLLKLDLHIIIGYNKIYVLPLIGIGGMSNNLIGSGLYSRCQTVFKPYMQG